MVIRFHGRGETDASDEQLQDFFQAAKDCRVPKPSWLSGHDHHVYASSDLATITQQCIDVYLLSQQRNGSMGGIGWWQCANGYTAMALHDLCSDPSDRYNYDCLDAAVRKCEARQRNLINVFNDDTLWWAMLCLHMYALRGESWYLDIARTIWKHVEESGSVCRKGEVLWQGKDMEGAVYWTTKPGEEQLNAISTALFAELSVRLAMMAKQQDHSQRDDCDIYILAAKRSLTWILKNRYRPQEGVVLDHIKLSQPHPVDWTFTYTTAVTLGVCALLYSATEAPSYLDLACHMADSAMTRDGWVEVSSGVLTEKGAYGRGTHDPWKNNDAVGFKAVLVRHLGVLYHVIQESRIPVPRAVETAETIERFVDVNFHTQVSRNSNEDGQYGPWWDGPFECPTSHSQMAVLDVIAAARLMTGGSWNLKQGDDDNG